MQWVSKDNIDCTWKTVEMIEDRILAASSFVDKGNIHTPKGWVDIEKVVFGLANTPVVAVGEDKAAQNPMPVKAAEGKVPPGSIHMDNHQFENAEIDIWRLLGSPVDRDVVIGMWEHPALATHQLGPRGEDISD